MNRRVQIFALLVFGAIVAIVAHPVLAIPDLVYPLDAVERTVSPRGKVRCPKVELETYRGTSIRYRRPVKIYVGFKSHLAAFEEVVVPNWVDEERKLEEERWREAVANASASAW